MAYFFGMDSNSVSTLFGSLNTASGASGMNFLTDYASIRNGSYGKLLRAHYNGQEASKKATDSVVKEDTTTKSEAITMRDAAADLKSSVNKLADKKDDLFARKEMKKEDGTTSNEYDTDAIYKAVNSFVKNYNATVEAAGDSQNNSVLNKASGMVSLTNTMRNVLGKVGISVSSNNQLSIDEAEFKKADMTTVKSLFQGTGGYAYQVGSAASTMINSSNNQIAQLSGSLYTSGGNYGNGFYSGSFYSDYF